MRKIIIQLSKLYSNSYVYIEHFFKKHSYENHIKQGYEVYISETNIFDDNSHTPEFKTLKELDIYLNDKIKNYKRIYK